MLVWINGAFGVGKTHTVFEVQRRADGVHVADPEPTGFGMRSMFPDPSTVDFQDLPQWRTTVVATLAQVVAAHPGPVLVPMTVVDPAIATEIFDGLTAAGVEHRHLALTASRSTIEARLRTRAAHARTWFGGEHWAVGQIDRCVDALAAPGFAEPIPTDGRSLDEVVEAVAAAAGIALVRPPFGPVRAQARRLAVGIRHLRF